MIARLTGTLVESRPEGVVLDVGGVGYALSIPLGTFSALPPPGGKATFHVHTHVREDALSLFGFATAQERELFEKLISVSGIGPKVALAVLSGMPMPDLLAAISAQDARRLSTIPGIGKKLAERLALELKDKVAAKGAPSAAAPAPGNASGDAVSALVNLGYKPAQAEAAVSAAAAAQDAPGEDLGKLLQAALRQLGASR